MNARVWHAN